MDFVATVGERFGALDILINNAAQTLYRPGAYHREVRAAEAEPLTGAAARLDVGATPAPGSGVVLLTSAAGLHAGTQAGPHAGTHAGPHAGMLAGMPAGGLPAGVAEAFFPAGFADETGEQLDLRRANSWTIRDADVSPDEWLQVHVVNAFAPFLLTSRLRPLMTAGGDRAGAGGAGARGAGGASMRGAGGASMRGAGSVSARGAGGADGEPWRHVVQVSAMEGSFSRQGKTVRHPHTNMAKASLNMMVRTVAADYVRDGVLMNAVDTGWVTDERPHPNKQYERAGGFRPPLDVVDGAARICHPIIAAERGEPVSGRFLKDYRSVPW